MGNATRVVLAVFILLAGQWLAGQPDLYQPLFDAIRDEVVVNEDPTTVPMQDEERWLVIIVEFPEDASGPGEDVSRAREMLTGINSAGTYFQEISAGRSVLYADVQEQIHTAKYSAAAYGQDEGADRDVGQSHTGGPPGLIEEAMTSTFSNLDISPYDLDDDGWIDRLLVLHTGDAQEDGGGPNAIWSHYSPISQGFTIGGVSVGGYTLASFDSGLGTIIHEMLHMLGGVDLYDVHSDVPSNEWNGIGDWDIMASGNWNGNGRTPALPTSATLELIGALDSLDLSVGQSGAENQSYSINPHVTNTGTVRIEIAPGEYIWMETRVESGFDRDLPGHGLLVTQQNRNNGDLEHNSVNLDPDFAWLKVIEADGNGGLLNGLDEGVSGDVFTSGKFGAEGILIRDGRGRLVPWTVEVTSSDSSGTDITISSPGAGHAKILPPPSPIRLLGSEMLPLVFTAREDCMPWSQLTSTDGRQVTLLGAHEMSAGEQSTFSLAWSVAAEAGTSGLIEGTIGCGTNNPATNVTIPWSLVNNRLIPEEKEDQIFYDSTSVVAFDLAFVGEGLTSYDVVVTGPLSRVATTESRQNLGHGTILSLNVEPQGLLSPGMIAKGRIQLYDSDGLAGEFNVTLQAEPPGTTGSILMWLAEPANNIQVISVLMALWAISGMRMRKEPPDDVMNVRRPSDQITHVPVLQVPADTYDEYGNLRS